MIVYFGDNVNLMH